MRWKEEEQRPSRGEKVELKGKKTINDFYTLCHANPLYLSLSLSLFSLLLSVSLSFLSISAKNLPVCVFF